jgi:hypothetical protein
MLFANMKYNYLEKLQEELDALLGDDRATFNDQARLPFASAVLAEVYKFI